MNYLDKLVTLFLTPCIRTTVILLAASAQLSHGAPSTQPKLYLGPAQWEVEDFRKETGGTLLVELLRQSVILSAELERQWLTYDITMGEPKPADADPLDIVIKYRVFEKQQCEYGVVTNGTDFLSGVIEIPQKQHLVYEAMLEKAEILSRDTFPKLLDEEQPQSSPASLSNTATIPESVFSQVNTFSLWNDLRTLHTLLETDGESPELLSALSQGYATFGLANHSLTTKMPKACYAKALIYAQRLVATRPNEARSYYTRAYAWTLPGFHALAIKDIEKAQELGGPAPSWLPNVQSYLDYDIPALKSALSRDDFNAQLAGTFLLMACYRTHNKNFIFEYAWPALEHNPKNLQLAHAGAVVGGLSTKGTLTSQYPLIFEYMIMNDLRSMENLDDILTPFITLPSQQEDDEADLDYPAIHQRLTSLVEQGEDTLKPSMGALATVIRETRFVQIWHRLQYLRYSWGVSTQNALTEMMPDIEGHPYATLLHTYSKTANIKEILGNQEIIDPPFQIYYLLYGRHITDEKAKFANQPQWRGQMLSLNNADYMALDLERRNSYWNQLDVSPNSINGIQKEFEHSKESPETLYTRFKTRVDQSALLSMALAQRLEKDGQAKGAAHFYQQSLNIKEYPKCLKAYAAFNLKEGNFEDWLRLQERSMELPDQAGLRNSYTRIDIARELLRQGHWETGLQYTEDAASSYTRTSLELAAWVNGLLGQPDRGLEYAVASMKRYSYSDFFNQYILSFAPTLTDEARALIEDYYQGELKENSAKLQAAAANRNFITEDYETYCEINEASLKATNDPWYGLVAALVAEDQGWIEKRDEILAATIERFPKLRRPSANRKAMKEFTDLYVEVNALGRMEPRHIEQVISFSKQFPDEGFNYDAHAMAGDLLRLKGHENEAREVFVNGLSPVYAKRMIGFIPFFRLRQMGDNPAQLLKERLLKDEPQ